MSVHPICYASAGINIALIKYWGKRDQDENLPAVGSLSLTLSPLGTETLVQWGVAGEHQVELNGVSRQDQKITAQLDWIRRHSGRDDFARVKSRNSVPTAAGLASSASGMAALSVAAWRAAGLPLSLEAYPRELLDLVRRGSGSAPRSLFGGWVELDRESGLPVQRADAESWDLQLIVCAVSSGEKAVSSRAGMRRSAETSPFYSSWVESHEADLRAAVEALEARSLSALGPLIEHSTFKMHACMWASRPPLRYLRGESVALLDLVESLRQQGLELWATMDAGPHVKVLCHRRDAARIREAIVASALCLKIYMLRPGPGLQLAERRSFEFGEEKR